MIAAEWQTLAGAAVLGLISAAIVLSLLVFAVSAWKQRGGKAVSYPTFKDSRPWWVCDEGERVAGPFPTERAARARARAMAHLYDPDEEPSFYVEQGRSR